MKSGPHCQLSSDAALRWALIAPGVKTVDNTAILKVSPPGRIKVFRHYWTNQNLGRPPASAADEAIAALGGYNDENLYVEGYNEVYQTRDQQLERYVDWQSSYSDRLHQRGYKSGGFGFSVGNPPDAGGWSAEQAWQYIQSKNFGNCDVLLLNQYFGTYSPAPAPNKWAISTNLRHRLVHSWCGGIHPPIIISEGGYDKVEVPGSPPAYSGWKLRPNYSGDLYVIDLQTLDSLLMEDDYVLLHVVFGAGPSNWPNFDVDGLHLEQKFNGPPPRLWWTPNPPPQENGMSIEELAQKPQRDDPSHPYGIWTGPGIKGTKGAIRAAWADTPDWQALFEIGGEAVVIDSHGVYRPNA